MKKTANGLVIVNQEQALKIIENLQKGICLLGDVGIGKTQVFKQAFENKNATIIGPMYTANYISALYNSEGMKGIHEKFKYQLEGRLGLVIDDIGTEVVSSNYGIKIDIIEWLILECYNVRTRIYLTSNLTLTSLTKRYGQRVIDRIKETTYVVVLEGKNYREENYANSEVELEKLLN